jgi:hypothetical protein
MPFESSPWAKRYRLRNYNKSAYNNQMQWAATESQSPRFGGGDFRWVTKVTCGQGLASIASSGAISAVILSVNMIDQKRKHILPELVRFACDPHIDAMTRSWVFDALRDVSGESIGDDPAQWRDWYASISRGGGIVSREADAGLVSAAWLQP